MLTTLHANERKQNLPYCYDKFDFNHIRLLIWRNMRHSNQTFTLKFRKMLDKNLADILFQIPDHSPKYVQIRKSQLNYMDHEIRRVLMLATIAENSKSATNLTSDQGKIIHLMELSSQSKALVNEVAEFRG